MENSWKAEKRPVKNMKDYSVVTEIRQMKQQTTSEKQIIFKNRMDLPSVKNQRVTTRLLRLVERLISVQARLSVWHLFTQFCSHHFDLTIRIGKNTTKGKASAFQLKKPKKALFGFQ
jgi:hypothetical protein